MEKSEILETLSALTAQLRPSSEAAAQDLEELRVLLVRKMMHAADRDLLQGDLHAPFTGPTLEQATSDTRRALEAAETRSRSSEPLSELPEGARLARRVLPFRSSAEPGSTPTFAAGMEPDRSFGPFTDLDGRPVIFELFLPIRKMAIIRKGDSAPFLTLPLLGIAAPNIVEYNLPAGSVWMLAKLFTADAPAGGYAGTRIKKGKLHLSAAPIVSGDNLLIPAGATVSLTLTLDPDTSAPGSSEPGVDAIEARAKLPAEVTFAFSPTGGSLTVAQKAGAKAFGAEVAMRYGAGPVTYDSRINRILFPFVHRPDEFAVGSSKSDLFKVKGTAPIEQAGWALAVSTAAAQNLGKASGGGAISISLGTGLQARWDGLHGVHSDLGACVVMVEPNRVALVAEGARAPGSTTRVKLWTGESPLEASWDATRHHLRYEAWGGDLDVVLMNAPLSARVDRPVAVNGRPFSIQASSSLTVFWRDRSAARLLAFAEPDAKQGETFALALKNALVNVSAPVFFALTGKVSSSNQISRGVAATLFRTGNTMLSLPDPYVTSQPIPQRLRGTATLSAQSSGPLMVSLVKWESPDAPKLTLDFLFPGRTQPATRTGIGTVSSLAMVPEVFTVKTADPEPPAPPPIFTSVSTFEPLVMAAIVDADEPPDPEKSADEDAEAYRRLVGLFEETAGPVRPQIALLDVSSNIDHLGVTWGYFARDKQPSDLDDLLRIEDLTITTRQRNARLFMLPQFQWEPLKNLPNPNIGFFPDRLVSGDDGGASLFGADTVRLVPLLPERTLEALVEGFDTTDIGAWFTLPFGIRAVAQLGPERLGARKWAEVELVQPATPDGGFEGGYQISVSSRAADVGPDIQTPSLTGAAWQTRNAVDPATGLPNGYSALRGDDLNAGVEPFFNNDFGPSEKTRRVPVSRVDFAGLGASTMSEWYNPTALGEISQVRFDTFIGRTAYEVVQAASILYPCAAPVVRTITIERRKEGNVVRSDSGWVATAPGLYSFPDPNPASSAIHTHAGVVRGFYDIRRIRETGRVVRRDMGGTKIELLEVRYDCDVEIEGVKKGNRPNTSRVTSVDQTGFVQRLPKGYPLFPEHFAQILGEEGPLGGPVDCEIDIGNSGQVMRVVWVDVDASSHLTPSVPEFAAAARGALALPGDAAWSVVRRTGFDAEFEAVDPVVGTPLIREGRATAPGSASSYYRFSDPTDLLREASPDREFALLQTSDAHQFMLPRPRIKTGTSKIETTELARLADAYGRAASAGIFPKKAACFQSQAPLSLDLVAGDRFRLGPAPSATFQNLPTAERAIVDGDALAIRTRYAGPIRFMLDPGDPEVWSIKIDKVTTSMDLGPFDDLMGVIHDYRASDIAPGQLINPKQTYAPFLDPVVKILQVLTDLLRLDDTFELNAVQGSFKFQARGKYPITGPGGGYFDFGAIKIKGELSAGFGWSEKDKWFGDLKIDLASKVPVLPPILANGKMSLKLKGTELNGQQVTIRVIWGVSLLDQEFGPLKVSAEFNYGIEVIVSDAGDWQIGLLVQLHGKAEILIVSISVKIELLAAIARDVADDKVEAIGQAKFAAEVSICWFLTISVDYTIDYREDLDI
jgi:hypothetical protein